MSNDAIEMPAGEVETSTGHLCTYDSIHMTIWSVLSGLSAIVGAYHGFHRNGRSWGWAIAWFFFGSFFPVIAPTYALIQGYAQPAEGAFDGPRRLEPAR